MGRISKIDISKDILYMLHVKLQASAINVLMMRLTITMKRFWVSNAVNPLARFEVHEIWDC